jgi:hypothetical protein
MMRGAGRPWTTGHPHNIALNGPRYQASGLRSWLVGRKGGQGKTGQERERVRQRRMGRSRVVIRYRADTVAAMAGLVEDNRG